MVFNCRIDKLDFALRSLQAQHQVAENENLKRSNLLEQTTSALSLLESENTRLKKVSTNLAYGSRGNNNNIKLCYKNKKNAVGLVGEKLICEKSMNFYEIISPYIMN